MHDWLNHWPHDKTHSIVPSLPGGQTDPKFQHLICSWPFWDQVSTSWRYMRANDTLHYYLNNNILCSENPMGFWNLTPWEPGKRTKYILYYTTIKFTKSIIKYVKLWSTSEKSIDNRSNELVNSFLIYVNTVLILNSLGANLSFTCV